MKQHTKEIIAASMVKGGFVFGFTCATMSFIEKAFMLPAIVLLIICAIGAHWLYKLVK